MELAHPVGIDVLQVVLRLSFSVSFTRVHTLNDLTGDLNVFLTSHEDQHIPWREGEMYLEHLLNGTVHIVFTW
jgi:hypothetical protein